MDFIEQVKLLTKTASELKDHLQTEEATKTALILPFFSALGYNVFNPFEFLPEPAADVGIKQGEKVDYAIMFEKDGQRDPMILIECKWCGSALTRKDSEVFRHFGLSQLFRYFGTTTAKYAILTNGLVYQFFTDLDEPNKMDLTPFLEIDLLNLQENLVPELKRFRKERFDPVAMADTASNLKYSKAIKDYFGEQLQNPDEEFVKWFTAHVYDGVKTAAVVDRFSGIVKTALNDFVAERLNDRIRTAFGDAAVPHKQAETAPLPVEDKPAEKTEDEPVSKIITTSEELEAFYAVKSILREVLPLERIAYKDTQTYFGVLVDGMVTRWVARLKLGEGKKTVQIPDAEKKAQTFTIDSVDDVYGLREQLIAAAKLYL